ncbi:MAG: hypothetical protein MPW15_16855 [Candidatus Manganitrophus sp.]|nr:hypothetical protein [Candidatus Manganitrophus sp.]
MVQIITSGWLTHPPHDPTISGQLTVNTDARISDNEMYFPQIICFSDIPIGELDIHIQKFSRFGLSFLKSFLVEAGGQSGFLHRQKRTLARQGTNRSGYPGRALRPNHPGISHSF